MSCVFLLSLLPGLGVDAPSSNITCVDPEPGQVCGTTFELNPRTLCICGQDLAGLSG